MASLELSTPRVDVTDLSDPVPVPPYKNTTCLCTSAEGPGFTLVSSYSVPDDSGVLFYDSRSIVLVRPRRDSIPLDAESGTYTHALTLSISE